MHGSSQQGLEASETFIYTMEPPGKVFVIRSKPLRHTINSYKALQESQGTVLLIILSAGPEP